jgi:uncharacterized iron-regulated membrane protein
MPSTKRPLGVLIAVLGVIFAAVALAGPASAAYPPTPPATTVGDQTPSAGSSFMVSGTGFGAGEKVTIVLSGGASLGTATADANGAFSFSVTLPSGVSGAQTIVFTGATSGKTSSQAITVGALAFTSAGGSTKTGGTLAFPGAAVMAIGSLALLLVLGGGLMMLAGRRRKAVI